MISLQKRSVKKIKIKIKIKVFLKMITLYRTAPLVFHLIIRFRQLFAHSKWVTLWDRTLQILTDEGFSKRKWKCAIFLFSIKDTGRANPLLCTLCAHVLQNFSFPWLVSQYAPFFTNQELRRSCKVVLNDPLASFWALIQKPCDLMHCIFTVQ